MLFIRNTFIIFATTKDKKGYIIYKKVLYNSKEEAVVALQKMAQRRREWVAQAEKELKEIATERQIS